MWRSSIFSNFKGFFDCKYAHFRGGYQISKKSIKIFFFLFFAYSSVCEPSAVIRKAFRPLPASLSWREKRCLKFKFVRKPTTEIFFWFKRNFFLPQKKSLLLKIKKKWIFFNNFFLRLILQQNAFLLMPMSAFYLKNSFL